MKSKKDKELSELKKENERLRRFNLKLIDFYNYALQQIGLIKDKKETQEVGFSGIENKGKRIGIILHNLKYPNEKKVEVPENVKTLREIFRGVGVDPELTKSSVWPFDNRLKDRNKSIEEFETEG